MLPQLNAGFKSRAPQKIYRPPNNPKVISGIQYESILRSEASEKRILRNPPAIAWDRDVIALADRNGVEILEVYIRDTQTTYRTTLTNLYNNGRIQTRFGAQWVLSLKYWAVDGQPRSAPEAEAKQLNLFEGV